jgi:UTP:GlnB (protein PII) uridylyltransferase
MLSSEERFEQALKAVTFAARPEHAEADGAGELDALLAALPPMTGKPENAAAEELRAVLDSRERHVEAKLGSYYAKRMALLAKANLEAEHSYEMMFTHARLVDGLHRFAFAVACQELPALTRLQVLGGERELAFEKELLPKKNESLAQAKAQVAALEEGEAVSASERAYYDQVEQNVAREVERCRERITRLEGGLPAWRAFRPARELLEQRLVLFARGGYGRAELSFSSDVDTGWVVETRGVPPGAEVILQELIVRAEKLLNKAGLRTAHQYFETGEDLTRFTEPDTVHTVPSVLEGRVILGNPAVLGKLQENFLAVLPYEEFLKKKISEFQAQNRPSLTDMDLKEDSGGLRTIQVPLWILGVTYRARSFMTGDLLTAARKHGLLSVWEASRYLRALELLCELRNFLGFAERHYFDKEARAGNFKIDAFPPNRLTDGLARLYLFRKGRFSSLDRLDAYRLRLASDVRRISAALLERMLDRTITHGLGDFGVSVHLGRNTITAILAPDGSVTEEPAALFHDRDAMLRLFGFVARTDYDLSEPLKDALSEAVRSLPAADAEHADARNAEGMSAIVGAPHAHRALETMLQISDPLSPELDTLLGRFIPEFDRIAFLVRDPKTASVPYHQRLIHCLENGQASLDWMKHEYPELHALLGAEHILAFK